jgi:hypothetical protein
MAVKAMQLKLGLPADSWPPQNCSRGCAVYTALLNERGSRGERYACAVIGRGRPCSSIAT